MIVFDEKKYSEDLLKQHEYKTKGSQGIERCVLVRYLNSIGYNYYQIREELGKLPMQGGEYLSTEQKYSLFDKIIGKALKYDFITDIVVNIYKDELKVIDSLENEQMKNVLFSYLVYYKWAIQIDHLMFYSKYNQIPMALANDKDIWKISKVNGLRLADRYLILNKLFELGLYRIDNLKSHNYVYFPFAMIDEDIEEEPIITINDYHNILGEYMLYSNDKEYQRCENCGEIIKRSNNKKYCASCSKKIQVEQIKRWKKNNKK